MMQLLYVGRVRCIAVVNVLFIQIAIGSTAPFRQLAFIINQTTFFFIIELYTTNVIMQICVRATVM